jgi:NAD(P)-dependent dehydrogenase (short-subunit alcohol dehydrogenase family)
MAKRRVRISQASGEKRAVTSPAEQSPAKKNRAKATQNKLLRGRFAGKLALVIGGAQGIGKAIALRLAAEGATVVIGDIDRSQLAATVREIEAGTGKAVGILCDVRKRRQVDRLVERVIRTWQQIDVLMYVAGVAKSVPFVETTDEIWDWTIDINLRGAFWFARAVAAQMIKQRQGKMVFMASTNAWDAEANLAPYNVSKAGLFLLAKTLARELGCHGICSNAVAPGLIRTRLTDPFLKDPDFMKKYSDLIPLGRVGIPEDVAGAAVFLASSDADYITGTLLFVDGGQLA